MARMHIVALSLLLLAAAVAVSHLASPALAQQNFDYEQPAQEQEPANDNSEFPGAENAEGGNADSQETAPMDSEKGQEGQDNPPGDAEQAQGENGDAPPGDAEQAQGENGDAQEKMTDTEGDQTSVAPGDTEDPSDNGAAAAAFPPGYAPPGYKYNFTPYQNSWQKIKGGEVGPETIIGAAIGAVVGMSLCICGICICYIRQRNIARAQYGSAGGGAIEL